MPVLDRSVQPLRAGEQLSREEFLSRWEALPSLKHAELIQGRVYLPSPISNLHSWLHALVAAWLTNYASYTRGCRAGLEATWLMLRDAPQPDGYLYILPEYGGQSHYAGMFSEGAPELVAEVCYTSKAHDLGPKLDLYLAAGVQEYLTAVLKGSKISWRYLSNGRYLELQPDDTGVIRSSVFPGLWLDVPALFANDGEQLRKTLERGVQSPEHERFVQELAERAPRK